MHSSFLSWASSPYDVVYWTLTSVPCCSCFSVLGTMTFRTPLSTFAWMCSGSVCRHQYYHISILQPFNL